MRYADAPHLDLASFRARRAGLGQLYRVAGYAACVVVLVRAGEPRFLSLFLIVMLVAWLMAWKREVGSLFRSPLVAAILMAAVAVGADRLGHPLHPRPGTATAPAEQPTRSIEFRWHGEPPPSPETR